MGRDRHPGWTSRPALEADVLQLKEQLFWERAKRYAVETRLEREMETSIRLGTKVVGLEYDLRACQGRFQWADSRVRRDR